MCPKEQEGLMGEEVGMWDGERELGMSEEAGGGQSLGVWVRGQEERGGWLVVEWHGFHHRSKLNNPVV